MQTICMDGQFFKNYLQMVLNGKKMYDEDSNEGYSLAVDVKYPKSSHNLHSDLPFSSERIKI